MSIKQEKTYSSPQVDWKLEAETELVRKNLEQCMRGSNPPRPVIPPIYTSSTYELESVEEGKVLSNTSAKVWTTSCLGRMTLTRH